MITGDIATLRPTAKGKGETYRYTPWRRSHHINAQAELRGLTIFCRAAVSFNLWLGHFE